MTSCKSRCFAALLGFVWLSGAGPATQPDAGLQADTLWTGTETGGGTKHEVGSARYAEMKILSRDGKTFTADYLLKPGNATCRASLEGRLGDKGEIAVKVTQMEKGSRWPDNIVGSVWSGTITGNTITLTRRDKTNQAITITLTRADAAESPPKRKRK